MFKKILVAAFLVLVVVSTSQAYDVMEAKGQWIEAGPGYGIVLNEKIDLLMVQKPYGRECFFMIKNQKTFFKEVDYVSFRVDKNKPEFFMVYEYRKNTAIVIVPNEYVKQVMDGHELTIKHGDRKFTFPLKNADDILYKVMTYKESNL
jgi:hypothetical protein